MTDSSTPAFNAQSDPGEKRQAIPSTVLMHRIKFMSGAGQHEEAAQLLQETLVAYPRDPYLHHCLAVTYGRMAEGEEDLLKARALNKKSLTQALTGLALDACDVPLLCQAGKCLRASGMYHEGESFFQRALQMDDKDVRSWNALGGLLTAFAEDPGADTTRERQDELYGRAADCHAAALELKPDDWMALQSLRYLQRRGYEGQAGRYDYHGHGTGKALRAIERFAAAMVAMPHAQAQRASPQAGP